MFFLTGVARFLFRADGRSRHGGDGLLVHPVGTLVPTMANYLLRKHAAHTDMHGLDGPLPRRAIPLVRFQRGFEAHFERLRLGYRELLEWRWAAVRSS